MTMPQTLLPCPRGQTPRAWQVAAVRALEVATKSKAVGGAGLSSVIIAAATGSGKGTLLAGLARRVEARGRLCLVLVHRNELIRDLAARVDLIPGRKPCGVVQGPDNGILAPVVVASVQTLRGRLDQIPPFDMVITDECHHATAKTYRSIVDAVNKARAEAGKQSPLIHVGFTATPYRSKANGQTEGLGDVYEALVYEHSIVDAIGQGDLVPPRAIRIETHVSVEGVKLKANGDFDDAELEAAVDTEARNELIVDKYLEHAKGQRCLAFATTVAHAKHLAEKFQAKGQKFEPIWGEMPKKDRDELLARFRSGEVTGLVSRDLLFEGFDAPFVTCLVRARPSQSRIILVQMAGRGLRTYPGKDECLILDFVDDGIEWDLSSISDMSEPSETLAKGRVKQRQYQAGDWVVLRHGSKGLGQVVSADETLARVAWAESEGGALQAHGHPELRVARPDELANEPPPPMQVGVTGEFLLSLLPGQKPESAAGWYAAPDCWIAIGRAPKSLPENSKIIGLVRRNKDGSFVGWAVTEIAAQEGPPTCTAAKVADGRDLRAVQAEVEAKLRRYGAVFSLATIAERSKAPATPAQIGRLRGLGISRDLRDTSKLEAG
jgi:superfamily II DNA or RNA helicase